QLPDALAREAEPLAHLFERQWFLAREPEAQRQDRALALGQCFEHLLDLFTADAARNIFELNVRGFVRNELTERRHAGFTDGRLERKQVRGKTAQLAYARERQACRARNLLVGRLAPELCFQLAARAAHADKKLVHVDRKTNGAATVGDTALDRLADPPRRVRGELEALPPLEL